MPYKVIWTEPAKKDMQAVADYIALEDKDAAKKVTLEIYFSAVALVEFPKRARIVPELMVNGIFKFRELIVSVWRVIFYITDDKVYIIAVIDSRRNVEDVLLKKLVL